METLVITPSNRKQAQQIKELAQKLGLTVSKLSTTEKEDLGLLRAMKEGEKDKRKVSMSTFFKNLES